MRIVRQAKQVNARVEAAERQRLVDDVAELRREARSAIPVAIAAVVALAVVTRSTGLTGAAELLWKLR